MPLPAIPVLIAIAKTVLSANAAVGAKASVGAGVGVGAKTAAGVAAGAKTAAGVAAGAKASAVGTSTLGASAAVTSVASYAITAGKDTDNFAKAVEIVVKLGKKINERMSRGESPLKAEDMESLGKMIGILTPIVGGTIGPAALPYAAASLGCSIADRGIGFFKDSDQIEAMTADHLNQMNSDQQREATNAVESELLANNEQIVAPNINQADLTMDAISLSVLEAAAIAFVSAVGGNQLALTVQKGLNTGVAIKSEIQEIHKKHQNGNNPFSKENAQSLLKIIGAVVSFTSPTPENGESTKQKIGFIAESGKSTAHNVKLAKDMLGSNNGEGRNLNAFAIPQNSAPSSPRESTASSSTITNAQRRSNSEEVSNTNSTSRRNRSPRL